MFFDRKLILASFLGVFLIEVLSLVGHFWPVFNIIGFVLVISLAVYLTWKKIEFGLLFILAELFVGSYGHLFAIGSFSIRMAIFSIVLLIWLVKKISTNQTSWPKNKVTYFYFGLLVFVLLGLIEGLTKNSLTNVYLDINAWAYFGLIFIFLDLKNKDEFLLKVFNVMFAAVSFVALQTILFFLTFSSGLNYIGDNIYIWFRDVRIGEITYIGDNLFRIFIQSQLYLVIGFLIFFTLFFLNWQKNNRKIKWWLAIFLYLISLAILISQSRSFWIGLLVGLIFLLAILFHQKIINFKLAILTIVILILGLYSQTLLIKITSNSAASIFNARLSNIDKQSANISRINQLQPLVSNIVDQSFFGFGFGKELTYKSEDPRVLEAYPDGFYTTFAFEWGYFDIALKIGLLGLLIYLLLIGKIFYNGFVKIKNQPEIIGLLAGLVALVVINIFSPYLNHPLGISYLLFLSVF